MRPASMHVPAVDHLDDNDASEFVSGTMAPSAVTKVENHLARCRDCRALVAALAADAGDDSNAATYPLERVSPSQVAQRPTRALTIGDRVGRYLVLSALGAGGMGVVFAAYDPQLDRKVALKLLRAGITYNTKDARARLRREAQAIAQLSHPNVVNVYDVGNTDEDDLYIAMEFVEGDTLTTWLKRYPRTPREIVDVFLQAARGLHAAHSVGLLHRDFKPDNVLVGSDGRVRVTDFGLARSVITPEEPRGPSGAARLSDELTATGTVLGTPRYMSPEQLTGPEIDARADQFSFCVALYEALFAVHPLPGGTAVAMLEKGEKATAPPETGKVPAEAARAAMRGLERDRGKRFPTMSALISELAPPPHRRWTGARIAVAAAAAAVLVGGAVAAVLQLRPRIVDTRPVDDAGNPVSGVTPLVEKINELTNVIHGLREQLRQALTLRESDKQTIEDLKDQLDVREREMSRLVEEILKRQKAPPPPPPPRPEANQGALVMGAVDAAQTPIEGCFLEWNERVPGADVDMLVRLTVNPDGVGHDAVASNMESPSVKLCVEGALVYNVTYPKGPEQLYLDVRIQWTAGTRMLSLQPRIVGRRLVPQGGIDLK
ncbi:MAG: serine/threonine protein kinase [Deltaproteobacteria bacterium]|nr:serine/threonine protein kinase [Deltaproteobacteria bacterium]